MDLPDPFGPMIAWISPLSSDRLRPLRISRALDLDVQVLDVQQLVGHLSVTSRLLVLGADQNKVALDLHWIGGYRFGRRKDAHASVAHVETGAVQVALDLHVVDVELAVGSDTVSS